MDWLRSEDLNEEKNVTASMVIIAVKADCSLWLRRAFTEQSEGAPAQVETGCRGTTLPEVTRKISVDSPSYHFIMILIQ